MSTSEGWWEGWILRIINHTTIPKRASNLHVYYEDVYDANCQLSRLVLVDVNKTVKKEGVGSLSFKLSLTLPQAP